MPNTSTSATAKAPAAQAKIGSATRIAYATARGTMYEGTAETVLVSDALKKHQGKVQLVFTSPPFPLNRKKRYGNLLGQQYIDWLAAFALTFRDLICKDGSVVLELGNAWVPGQPIMSPLALKALLAFLEKADLQLCQQFVCYNPARLPSPAQWVNVERIRVKDAYTHVWWMSTTDRPKADNRRVLKEYSASMLNLLKTQKYNPGTRPSSHRIGATSFLTDNKGAIPSNVITLSNTASGDEYLQYCRRNRLKPHDARMQPGLPEFFIKFLTEPGDLVLDPFGGSNTTGAVAEQLKRRWIAVEPSTDYIAGSRGRFPADAFTK